MEELCGQERGWPLRTENRPQLAESKETETSVLQPQGPELGQELKEPVNHSSQVKTPDESTVDQPTGANL